VSTLSLPFATRARPGYVRPIAERAGGIPLDLRSSRIHVETDRGLVVAFYVDAKPRQDAIVIPLVAGNSYGGEPTPEVMRHAQLLLASGVSVLLVDVTWYDGWRGRLLGRNRGMAIRAGLDYLVARGHNESDCVVDGR